jgi:hypothetical protein
MALMDIAGNKVVCDTHTFLLLGFSPGFQLFAHK